MKKTMKRISALVLCMCLVCLAVFTGCTKDDGLTKKYFEENTTEVLKSSIDYEAVFGNMEPLGILAEEKNAGVEAKMDLTQFVGFDLAVVLDSAVSESDGFALKLALEGKDENELDLGIFFDKEGLYLSSKALTTEDKAYGIKFDSIENLAKKFDESSFAKILGLPENAAKAFFEENGITDEYIKNVAEAYKKFAQVSEGYTFDYIYDRLLRAYEPYYGEIKEETVDVNGVKTDVLTLSMNVNKEMLLSSINVYTDIYMEILGAQNEFYTAIVPESMKETVLPMITASKEDFVTLFGEAKDAIDEASGTVTLSIDRKTGLAVMAKGNIDVTSYGEKVNVDVTEYIGDDITYTGSVTADGETQVLSGRLYRDETENGTKLALEMTLGEGEDAKTLEVGLDTQKAEKSYKFYINDSESMTDISVNGTYDISDTVFALTVDSVYGAGEETALGISYKFDLNRKPEMPSEKEDLLELSEDGVYALIGRISSSAQKLSGMFEGEEPSPELEYTPEAEYNPISYDDYELYSEHYTYEEFCEFADVYNMAIAN